MYKCRSTIQEVEEWRKEWREREGGERWVFKSFLNMGRDAQSCFMEDVACGHSTSKVAQTFILTRSEALKLSQVT